jgi:hypothetical protein
MLDFGYIYIITYIESQAMGVLGTTGAPSFTRCCGAETKSITHAECVFVGLCIEHAMHMRHFVICKLSGCTISLHLISKRHD